MVDNVVNIGDFRFRAQERKRPWAFGDKRCDHRKLTLDEQGHIVRCETCGETVSAFWTLQMLVDDLEREQRKLHGARQQVESDKAASVHLRAAKKVERVWRSKHMVPNCPHCRRGILPEDGLGDSQTRREFELAKRKPSPRQTQEE